MPSYGLTQAGLILLLFYKVCLSSIQAWVTSDLSIVKRSHKESCKPRQKNSSNYLLRELNLHCTYSVLGAALSASRRVTH